MRILIIGGAGFVGDTLVKYLNKENEIIVLDNYFTSNPKADNRNVKYIYGNSWDIKKLGVNLDFDIVFHFGEYSRIATSFEDIEYVLQSNLYGTSCIIELCKKRNIKLIYSASSSKFGNNGEDENLCPYAWVKAKNVELIKNYHKWFDLQYEICYFYNVYGKNEINAGKYATLIGIFTNQFLNNEPLTIVGDGMQTRQFTHIDDITNGVVKTMNMNMNKEWFLSSDQSYSINEVAEMFGGKIKYIPKRKGEREKSVFVKNDTKKILNWEIKNNLKDWINKFKNGKR